MRGKEGVESELRLLHRSHEAARDAGEGDRGCVRSDTEGAGTTREQHEDARTDARSSSKVDEAALSFRFLGRHKWVPNKPNTLLDVPVEVLGWFCRMDNMFDPKHQIKARKGFRALYFSECPMFSNEGF